MKYVTVLADASLPLTLTLSPSKSTLGAIKRLESGQGRDETRIQRFKEIYKLFPSDSLKNQILLWEHALDVEKKLASVTAENKTNSTFFRVDINYYKRELEIFKELSDNEKEWYWRNLRKLSEREKLKDKFKDHPLKDFSLSGTSIKYKQNLSGMRSFCLRSDPYYSKRVKKDPSTKSNAIICLYEVLPINDISAKIILYNIGWHDEVYNTDISDYKILLYNNK